jgi:formamidopyrimidine-DNA glycosylase
MPEYPDIIVYLERLRPRIGGQPLQHVRLASPFLLRTVDPPLAGVCGQRVSAIRRLGKRIVLELTDDLFLVLHLMIAGRLHWKPRAAKLPGKVGLAGNGKKASPNSGAVSEPSYAAVAVDRAFLRNRMTSR